jgi:regulator of RNase E activity RraB
MIGLIVGVVLMAVVFGWMLFGDRLAPGEPANKMDEMRQRLEISLDELREDGVDVDEPILWNYLFVHRDYPQLGRFIEHMRRTGYQVAEVNEVDDGETGVVDYELRLQIVERHTPDSLAKKLNEMRDLAAKWELDLFDGWYPEGYVGRREMSH